MWLEETIEELDVLASSDPMVLIGRHFTCDKADGTFKAKFLKFQDILIYTRRPLGIREHQPFCAVSEYYGMRFLDKFSQEVFSHRAPYWAGLGLGTGIAGAIQQCIAIA